MASKAKPAAFLPLGAIIQQYRVNGINIVQNFPTAELYQQHNAPFFGETIGRVANRISGAKINNLNGRSYQLAANNGPNSLHGGKMGWGTRVFDGPTTVQRNGKEATMFKYVSKDGEEGYPGTVELRVWYTTYTEKDQGSSVNVLEAEYEVELVDDEDVQETAVAVTNHSYFNLSGDNAPSIEGTEVTLSTNMHQVVDDVDIPTGPIEPYPGVEANRAFTLGPKEPDIDHCFVLDTSPETIPIDTRSEPLRKLASFYHPTTKIHLEVHSTEPAFQFYTGKYIDVPAVAGLPARGPRSGFCVEPSRYINAVNVDRWRSMVVLKRGSKFGSKFVYRAWQSE
jgi:aldose 1-epimerase